LIAGLRSIYRTEGFRGFFHGLTPTIVGVSHGSLYFLAYEKLKIWRRESKQSDQLSNLDTLATSSLSKVFAGSITYPHQLVRARLQTYDPKASTPPRGVGVISTIKSVWFNEGIVGFYKGMFPNLVRVIPSTCVTFLVYENVRWALPRLFGDGDAEPPLSAPTTSQQKKGAL
jgi:solute carrier family 25 folate transporter 32